LFAGALLAAGVALRCGGGGSGSTAPTVVTLAPAPSPSATPSPAAAPGAGAQGCRLPAQPECSEHGGGGCCSRTSDELGEYVELAIRDVQAQRPDLFDGDKIKDEYDELLVVELIAERLETRFGLCAKPASPVEDEIAVKRSNEFSEQFDVILSNHYVNVWGYTVTCRPARF
jgi:hypothetical protein